MLVDDGDGLPPYNTEDIGLEMKNFAKRLPQSRLR